MTDLRDRLAVLCGWTFDNGEGLWWHADHPWQEQHPFPANDLNALAAAWPAGWKWGRFNSMWGACPIGGLPDVVVPDTGDEYADRLRLTVAVLETIARESK